MSPKSFFVGAIFCSLVTATIAVLSILAMKQATEEELEGESKKAPIEHDETCWELYIGKKSWQVIIFKKQNWEC